MVVLLRGESCRLPTQKKEEEEQYFFRLPNKQKHKQIQSIINQLTKHRLTKLSSVQNDNAGQGTQIQRSNNYTVSQKKRVNFEKV